MCLTDVGDESVVGLGDGAELGDVPWLARSHLDEGELVFCPEAKECQGDTDMIVEVALGVEEAVALGEDSCCELLGGRLAVGACDSDHGQAECLAVVVGELL